MARLQCVLKKNPKSAWALWNVICDAIHERNMNLREDLLQKKCVEAFAEEIRRRSLEPACQKQRRKQQDWVTSSAMGIDRRQSPERRAHVD